MKKVSQVIGILFLVLAMGGGIYAYSIYNSAKKAMDSVYENVNTENVREAELTEGNQEPFSILLLGVDRDEGRGSSGRSDTMMVVTVNPEEGSTKILSIARDTRTEIIGKGFDDKINHAYAFGGAEMTINTVQNFLNIPIDYYVEIDMDGFKELVDLVGEVTVENTLEFSQDGFHFPVGRLILNGEEILAYTRMRYEDPNGDFGRQARQRQVLVQLVTELSKVAVTNYQSILDTVSQYMVTNIKMEDIISMSMNCRNALNEMEQVELRGSDQIIDGIYYQIISDEDVKAMSETLRQHLELE